MGSLALILVSHGQITFSLYWGRRKGSGTVHKHYTHLQKVTKSDPSAYNRSPPNLPKEWWRMFICQVSAVSFILWSVKSTAFGASIQGAYALLEPTSKGCDAIANDGLILLPECANLQSLITTARAKTNSKHHIGKGMHMLPILKRLIDDDKNWLKLTPRNKERYLFPGWHDGNVGNACSLLYWQCHHTSSVQWRTSFMARHPIWKGHAVLLRMQCQWW